MFFIKVIPLLVTSLSLAKSAGAVEYADCISPEGKEPLSWSRKYLGYDTKPFDGGVLVLEV